MTMRKLKQYRNVALALGFAVAASSCSKDDNGGNDRPNEPIIEGGQAYVLGVGVEAGTDYINYIVHTKDLLNGKISLLNNGILQEGYREYLNINNYFYSIGGLGVNNVDAYYINNESRLTAKTGLAFSYGADDYLSVNNDKTLLGAKLVVDDKFDGNMEFFEVDADGYTVNKTVKVPAKEVYKDAENKHGWRHTGLAVSGDRAYQTVFPYANGVSPNLDTNYVEVYSYPELELETVIKDTRTGPAGAPVNISGIFTAENGDVYTVYHGGYGFDPKGNYKEGGILRIKAGTAEFDQGYHFTTEDKPNGGKFIKATYIGNNKLLAQKYTAEQNGQWDQTNLTFVIVDLEAETITAVKDAPIYQYSEPAFVDGDKAYVPAKVGASLHIYQIDIPTATATKGIEIEASYVKGIGKLHKQ